MDEASQGFVALSGPDSASEQPGSSKKPVISDIRALQTRLLAWYDRHRRRLPWRAEAGAKPDPYRVWLSEIMLQQTTVTTVMPYYTGFLQRWPTLKTLAAASLDEVLTAWSGLGYYARARNLHACAKAVMELHGGQFPEDEDGLRALPGIGRYTAAAIAAIAFGRAASPVDGNIERVMARLHAIEEPLPGAKSTLAKLAKALSPETRAGDHAQALMDLGATICTPKSPKCLLCPWTEDCAARALGLETLLPRKTEKGVKPLRRGVAFWLEQPSGAVLFRKRPEEGLLGGLWEVPSTPWEAEWPDDAKARRMAPMAVRWKKMTGLVTHSFTHFDLELSLWRGVAGSGETKIDGRWINLSRIAEIALSNLMKKVVAHATHG
jgi:A/G-specific adenine glycosylase